MVDTDRSGSISVEEFGVLLRLQGEELTHEDVTRILEEIDVDGDASNLTFDEFVQLLDGIEFPDGKIFAHDVVAAFARMAKEKSKYFQSKDPLYVAIMDRNVGFSNAKNARMQLAAVVDGNVTQIIVMTLIVVDVICVICELLLVATKCPCAEYGADSYYYGSNNSSYGYGDDPRRVLGAHDNAYTEPYGDYQETPPATAGEVADRVLAWGTQRLRGGAQQALPVAAGLVHRLLEWWAQAGSWLSGGQGDDAWAEETARQLGGGACEEGTKVYSHEQHVYEHAFHMVSVGILYVFATQIFVLMCLYGLEFFQNGFYVMDLVVIVGAIILESMHITAGHLFVLLLSWRGLRVVHGLMTSIELQHKIQHERVVSERGKLIKMITSTRRELGQRSYYFLDFHNRIVGAGADAMRKQSIMSGPPDPAIMGEGNERQEADAEAEAQAAESQHKKTLGKIRSAVDAVVASNTAAAAIKERAAKKERIYVDPEGMLSFKGVCRTSSANLKEVDLDELSAEEMRAHLREALVGKKMAEEMYLELYNTIEAHRESLGETVQNLQAHDQSEHNMLPNLGVNDIKDAAEVGVKSMRNAAMTLSMRGSSIVSRGSMLLRGDASSSPSSSLRGNLEDSNLLPPSSIAEFAGHKPRANDGDIALTPTNAAIPEGEVGGDQGSDNERLALRPQSPSQLPPVRVHAAELHTGTDAADS